MLIKTVKVSSKGQIAIPAEVRTGAGIEEGDELVVLQEGGRILITKASAVSKRLGSGFGDLLKHSEKVAEKLWSNKEDEIWDSL